MPTLLKQVISSFLTWSAYKKLAMSMTWQISPGALYIFSVTDRLTLTAIFVFIYKV